MSNATWWELLIMLPAAVFSAYALAWSVPGAIMNAMVSLGDPQRIVYIDKQLSKNVDKLHSDLSCMVSANIGTRLFGYWFKYPFISNRIVGSSIKFRIFMWVNALGLWSWVGTLTCLALAKVVGIMP